MSDTYDFKFLWLDGNGNPQGMFRKKGNFNGETLVLDDAEIPAVIITESIARADRLIISAIGEGDQPAVFGIVVTPRVAEDLKRLIDNARSAQWAEMHRKEAGSNHRDAPCRQCGATLILTDMPETPQLYCHFCDTLTTVDPVQMPAPGEQHLRVCEECGMFSMPRKFTVFYFYCLLVVYGWRYRTTWRCPACMRGDAWKMLFGNLLFVIGVPVAIFQLIRSYGGGISGGAFAGLDTANIKARSGDLMGAIEIYRKILDKVPHSAGLKYNVGLALLQQGDKERAAESFRMALDDCSNYVPAFQLLAPLYDELGRTGELARLKKMWGIEDEEQPQKLEPAAEPVFEQPEDY